MLDTCASEADSSSRSNDGEFRSAFESHSQMDGHETRAAAWRRSAVEAGKERMRQS